MIDLEQLKADAEGAAKRQRDRGEIADAIQWEQIANAAGALRRIAQRRAEKRLG